MTTSVLRAQKLLRRRANQRHDNRRDGGNLIMSSASATYRNDQVVTLDDIASCNCDVNLIALGLKSGNVISVANGDAISPTFKLADSSAYRYNRTSNSWQGA